MNPFNKNRKHLGIFITAGFPEKESLPDLMLKLQEEGASFIEVGMPFSDPLADGEIIQASSNIAIANGMNLDLMFDQLLLIRDQMKIPVILMGYLNSVISYGIEKFLMRCREVSIGGILLPDLPLEIYKQDFEDLFKVHQQKPIFMITLKTDRLRMIEMVAHCKDTFVYLIAQNSTTGGQKILEIDEGKVRDIVKGANGTPIFMGFGIKSDRDILQVQAVCDGAIIGSAYLKSLM